IKEQTSQMGTGLYTPGYAPYEHIMGRAIAASDLYSLAATCVRLLTGCLPPRNSNLVDPVYDVDERRWLWQSVLNSQKRSISDFLANLLNKMLEDKSSKRYQSASEVLIALNNTLSSTTVVQPITASPPPQRTINTTNPLTNFTERLLNRMTLEMVNLPAGQFLMGSPDSDPDAESWEKYQHLVKVNSFAIGKYP
ncbi:MAG: hypothetical protein ACKO7A_31005, partial [Microcystis sp.]